MIVEEFTNHQDYISTQLKKEVDQLKIILSHAPGNLFWKNREGQYLGCNQSVLDMHGLDHLSDFVGKTVCDFYDKDHADEITAKDQFIFKGKQPILMEEIGYDKDGKESIYLTRKIPLHDTQGEVIGLIGIALDITAQKTVDKLIKQEEIQKGVIKKLKATSAALSYEIRSPMAGIRLGLERTKQFFNKVARLVKRTHMCAECESHNEVTLEELTTSQQLLTKMMQRIDTGVTLMEMQLKNMVTDQVEKRFFHHHEMKESVQQAVNTFPLEDKLLLNQIHIDLKHPFTILGDRMLTKHLLWNLLNNALQVVKAQARGEIFITTEEMIEYHLLRFKDTAKGMSREETAQIFESFHTNSKEGCGLGLHFCQLVMKAYGGRIKCQAKEGQYTEFLLFFPKKLV